LRFEPRRDAGVHRAGGAADTDALVRGREAETAVYAVSPTDFSWAPEWSRSGRGRVVPLTVADDIAA
jgi:hypothetical protein